MPKALARNYYNASSLAAARRSRTGGDLPPFTDPACSRKKSAAAGRLYGADGRQLHSPLPRRVLASKPPKPTKLETEAKLTHYERKVNSLATRLPPSMRRGLVFESDEAPLEIDSLRAEYGQTRQRSRSTPALIVAAARREQDGVVIGRDGAEVASDAASAYAVTQAQPLARTRCERDSGAAITSGKRGDAYNVQVVDAEDDDIAVEAWRSDAFATRRVAMSCLDPSIQAVLRRRRAEERAEQRRAAADGISSDASRLLPGSVPWSTLLPGVRVNIRNTLADKGY